MSLALSQIEIQQFLSDAHAEFQSTGFLLENTVRTQTGVKGAILNFPVFGQGVANQKAPQDDVVPLNISNRNVELTLQDWYAPEYVDRTFQYKIAVNAVDEYVKLCSWALARRSDQMIIDQANLQAYSLTPNDTQGQLVAAGGTGFTYDKLRAVHKALRARSANFGKKYIVIDAEAEADLLNEEKVTSGFYINNKPIPGLDGLNGANVLGMNFIVIPDMTEGGLPAGTAFAWNDQAMGYGSADRLGGDISWENIKTSYLINMWLSANAAVIDPKGMVKVEFV
jgi:hypothetical protein